MNALYIAKVLLAATATVALGIVAYEGLTIGEALKSTVTAYSSIPAKAGATLDWINRPGTGTLAEVDKALLATKSLEVHADMAVAHEDRQLATLDTQEAAIFSDLHKTAMGAQQATTKLSGIEDEATGALRATTVALGGLTPVEAHLDGLISDPDIMNALKHANNTLSNVDLMSHDTKMKYHDILYPPPCTGHGCWIKKSAKTIVGIADFGAKAGEAGYWINQLIK